MKVEGFFKQQGVGTFLCHNGLGPITMGQLFRSTFCATALFEIEMERIQFEQVSNSKAKLVEIDKKFYSSKCEKYSKKKYKLNG